MKGFSLGGRLIKDRHVHQSHPIHLHCGMPSQLVTQAVLTHPLLA